MKLIIREIFTNTIWISIGNVSTVISGFLLIPLYTSTLTVSNYGAIDLVMILISFFLPFVTLQSADALQTFLLKKRQNNNNLFFNSIIIFIVGFLFSLLFFKVVDSFSDGMALWFYIVLLLMGLNMILSSFYKGINKIKISSFSSVIESLSLIITMFVLLSYYNQGIRGFFISIIFSKSLSFIFYLSHFILFENDKDFEINLKTVKLILVFSIPLIPNMLGWWISNLSDRYLIKYFLGFESNGIYALAVKFPLIINVIGSILISSWMISSIKNIELKNSRLFKGMFFLFSNILLTLVIGIVFILPYIFPLIIKSNQYFEAMEYIPILMISVFFSAFSSLFGVTYLAENKTKLAALTTIISGLLNILLNLILIPIYGIWGAVISTLISFLVISIQRYFFVKKNTSIRFSYTHFIMLLCLIFLKQLFSYSLISFIFSQTIILFLLFLSMFLLYRNFKDLKNLS